MIFGQASDEDLQFKALRGCWRRVCPHASSSVALVVDPASGVVDAVAVYDFRVRTRRIGAPSIGELHRGQVIEPSTRKYFPAAFSTLFPLIVDARAVVLDVGMALRKTGTVESIKAARSLDHDNFTASSTVLHADKPDDRQTG